jgi:four helix bundle protein
MLTALMQRLRTSRKKLKADGRQPIAFMGSASELEYHLLLARDLKMIPLVDYEELSPRAIELKRMLTALMQRLRTNRKKLIADS